MKREASSIRRIVDANLNRAREAARVLEDIARFHVESRTLSASFKRMRHDIAALRGSADPAGFRDTGGDVGTGISVPEETGREGIGALARANSARLGESLRVLEESYKCENPEPAAKTEQIRYTAYRLCSALERQIEVRPRLDNVRLCVIITDSMSRHGAIETARRAIEGGADMIQLREKEMEDGECLKLAREMRELTRSAGVLFIVNDRADVASACGADGVHVGAGDLPVPAVRKIIGPDAIVGASAHGMDELRRAVEDGADYLGVGPAFETDTKPHEPVRGLGFVGEAAAEAGIPCFAIGGINSSNIAEVTAAGIGRVAVSAGIIAAENVTAAAKTIKYQLPEISQEKEA
ncbi:MAG: thiamine phosphate synthase [Planctomycetota bacterium]|jgi:thiamine-phosphate pyrophosphorylase